MQAGTIVSGLLVLANEHRTTALFWHAVLLAALLWVACARARPPRVVVAMLLMTPVVSAATLALLHVHRFNGVALTVLLALLGAAVIQVPALPVERARGLGWWLGWLLVALAAGYPHFAQVPAAWQYALYAPLGVLPCPTLALLVGGSLLTSGLQSRAWCMAVSAFALAYGMLGAFWLGVWLDLALVIGALALLAFSLKLAPRTRASVVAVLLALSWPWLGAHAQASKRDAPEHADAALARAREDEKLTEDVEQALSQRWPNLAVILQDTQHPLRTTADVLHGRGLPDLEGGLPAGVFSRNAARRRYFAALWLGWPTEVNALSVVARLEASRLASLLAARAELPDVEQRLTLDELARASSERLHAVCERFSALGGACAKTLLEPNLSVPRT